MLSAQHSDATNVMSTISGEANPAYDTTITSAVITDDARAERGYPRRPDNPAGQPAGLQVPLSRGHYHLT